MVVVSVGWLRLWWLVLKVVAVVIDSGEMMMPALMVRNG